MENYEKKYKEAFERAKDLHDNHPYGEPPVWTTCEKIFPELKESEDEKIRKEITRFLINFNNGCYTRPKETDVADWIAWLEKQGEQDIIDLKEYAKGILKGAAIHLILWIDENLADGKMCLSNMECEDLEDAMVNAKWDKIHNYIKKKVEKQDEHKPSWSEEDDDIFNNIIAELELVKKDVGEINYPSYDRLINWLKSLKDRVQPQLKQEWSEEDEARYWSCLRRLGTGNLKQPETIDSKWFKEHIVRQPDWKPSEKQMKAIKYFIDFHRPQANASTEGWQEFKRLESLYNDLKKL